MKDLRTEIEEGCNELYNKHYGEAFICNKISTCLEHMLAQNKIVDYQVKILKGDDVFVYYRKTRMDDIDSIKLSSMKRIRNEKLKEILK
jgi:hypothetical protein